MKKSTNAMTRMVLLAAMAAALGTASMGLHAKDQDRDRSAIYGSQLMTQTERDAYRSQMQSLTTDQERDALQQEHRDRMRQRALDKGVKLRDRHDDDHKKSSREDRKQRSGSGDRQGNMQHR